MVKMKEKHEFALYIEHTKKSLAMVKEGIEWAVDDEQLYTRIVKVLRLSVGDIVILFDRMVHAWCKIDKIYGKRGIAFQIIARENNGHLAPHITCALPLLKRDDLENALYILAELGVNTVQLLSTEKSRSLIAFEKEYERLERIVIAAAEQSKHFALPLVKKPVSLETWCQLMELCKNTKIYFDVEGDSLISQLNKVTSTYEYGMPYILMVGPEGDLTTQEKMRIREVGFTFCRLTPTVLRAAHALCVGVGAFRSL